MILADDAAQAEVPGRNRQELVLEFAQRVAWGALRATLSCPLFAELSS
jgi:hypothetical protein